MADEKKDAHPHRASIPLDVLKQVAKQLRVSLDRIGRDAPAIRAAIEDVGGGGFLDAIAAQPDLASEHTQKQVAASTRAVLGEPAAAPAPFPPPNCLPRPASAAVCSAAPARRSRAPSQLLYLMSYPPRLQAHRAGRQRSRVMLLARWPRPRPLRLYRHQHR